LIVSALLGVWLMAAPGVLGYGNPASAADRIAGPVALGVALLALHEVARPLRWANVPVGLAFVVLPWPLGFSGAALANSLVVGILLIGLAPVRGALRHPYGGGWRAVWRPTDPGVR
jgi:hypothetical protein